MKLVRLVVAFLLSIGVSTASGLTWMAAEPTVRPVSRLNVEQLTKTLDREDIAGAVRQVEIAWKQQFEDYYQGKLIAQLVEIDGISNTLNRIANLTGKKSALIYAIPTPNHLELILVSPQLPPVHKRIVAANKASLTQAIGAFRDEVANSASRPSKLRQSAQQLYQLLISPIEPTLRAQKIDTLIFCLGAGLRSVPLAALYDGKQFLVEKYSLAIIPAFTLLDRNPAALKGTKVLAMGASKFQNQPALPAVPIEVSAIADGLWQGESLLNEQFTPENLRAERAKYPYGIVHLATHAEFLPGSVDKSYIQFWNAQLRLNQLKDLKLRIPVVQLLVLSACSTALGDPQAELGFAGLAVQSGAKAAIASLWAVDDAATVMLMTEFYRQLKTAPTKVDALRQAQIALLKKQINLKNNSAILARGKQPLPPELMNIESTDLSHPYYWAAFTLIGNPW
jgi:CHAT domain-containing protein